MFYFAYNKPKTFIDLKSSLPLKICLTTEQVSCQKIKTQHFDNSVSTKRHYSGLNRIRMQTTYFLDTPKKNIACIAVVNREEGKGTAPYSNKEARFQ